jgi:hypothetical protein
MSIYFLLGRRAYSFDLPIISQPYSHSNAVYSNSMLATLNARRSINGMPEEDGDHISFSLSRAVNDFSNMKTFTSEVSVILMHR